MKKQVLIATGLAVLSTSAYATKARMDALGQDVDQGSLYILDSRSIFRNAAHVNTFTNYVVTEWGIANNAADGAGAPHAEGGFFRDTGSFSYGLYLGNEQDADNAMRLGNSADGFAAQLDPSGQTSGVTVGAAGFEAHDNSVDLFFGGDMGVEWGAKVHYASGSTKAAAASSNENTHDALGLGLGATMGDLEGYVNLELKDESEGSDNDSGDKWEADTGIQVGASYRMGDMTFFADYETEGAEYTNNAASTTTKTERDTIQVGVGKTHELSSTSRVYMDIKYQSISAEDTPAGGGNADEVEQTTLPVTIGYETDANDWLALRGSVQQDLPFLNKVDITTGGNSGEQDTNNLTNVTAGATLNFGKLKVDGMIGTDGGGNNAAANRTTAGGVLSLDDVMSRVAVHYWF